MGQSPSGGLVWELLNLKAIEVYDASRRYTHRLFEEMLISQVFWSTTM